MDRRIQVSRLAAAGADEAQIEELLRYNESAFEDAGASRVAVPLPDEPFVECWSSWAEEARTEGVLPVLVRHLPQLSFPVEEGISGRDDYRAAVLRGVPVEDLATATGLELERPESLELELHPSLAGRIPCLVSRWRPDFVTLVRTLAKKNEPADVPEAQGAAMVAGFNNWARIRRLRREWEALDPEERGTTSWNEEFARIRATKELYQDRFIVLSDGPYSAVPAADLGLDVGEWREMSLALRREHECTHYFTRRFYGSMRNHVLDEMIADYMGMVAACGRYRADWFLRFVGLEEFPRYRRGARLDIYRGNPPLSDGAFAILHALVRDGAAELERFDRGWPEGPRSPEDRALAIRAMASLSFLELAAPGAADRLEEYCAFLRSV